MRTVTTAALLVGLSLFAGAVAWRSLTAPEPYRPPADPRAALVRELRRLAGEEQEARGRFIAARTAVKVAAARGTATAPLAAECEAIERELAALTANRVETQRLLDAVDVHVADDRAPPDLNPDVYVAVRAWLLRGKAE